MVAPIREECLRRVTIVDGPPRHQAFPALELLENGDMLVAYRKYHSLRSMPGSFGRPGRADCCFSPAD